MSFNRRFWTSVRFLQVTIGAGSASATGALTPNVVVANTLVVPAGGSHSVSSTNIADHLTAVTGISASLLTVSRSGASLAAIIKRNFWIYEFNPALIRTIQYFTIVQTAGGNLTDDYTISPVLANVNNAQVIGLGSHTTSDGTTSADTDAELSIVSTSIVRATRLGTTVAATISGVLIETP